MEESNEAARLRAKAAEHLRNVIQRDCEASGRSTSEAYKLFFIKDLGLAYDEPSGGSPTVGNYGIGPARGVMDRLLSAQPAFPKGMTAGPRADFERAILSHLKKMEVISETDASTNFLRKNSDFAKRQRFANDSLLRLADGTPEFLVRRFIELAARQTDARCLLDDACTHGLFFFGVTAIGFSFLNEGQKTFTFSDLFSFSNEEFYNRFDANKVEGFVVKRIDPTGKPTLSEQEIASFLYRRYGRGEGIADKSSLGSTRIAINDFSISLTIRLVDLFIHLISSHMNIVHDIFTDKLASGTLARTVFDIEYGALYVNQADEGRYWTVGITPIQGRVDGADGIIQNDIIGSFEKTVKKHRHSN